MTDQVQLPSLEVFGNEPIDENSTPLPLKKIHIDIHELANYILFQIQVNSIQLFFKVPLLNTMP